MLISVKLLTLPKYQKWQEKYNAGNSHLPSVLLWLGDGHARSVFTHLFVCDRLTANINWFVTLSVKFKLTNQLTRVTPLAGGVPAKLLGLVAHEVEDWRRTRMFRWTLTSCPSVDSAVGRDIPHPWSWINIHLITNSLKLLNEVSKYDGWQNTVVVRHLVPWPWSWPWPWPRGTWMDDKITIMLILPWILSWLAPLMLQIRNLTRGSS